MINDSSFPKISCVMVTNEGRLDTLSVSLKCFLDQTYPNKELLILNDSSEGYKNSIRKLVNEHKDVRLIFLDGKYSLGALRNISVGLSKGDIFVQWDDDDFCSPQRLMVQYNHLSKTNSRFCFLGDQLHYYFPNKKLFWDNWDIHSGGYTKYQLIPGSIMAYIEGFHYRYPASGEYCAAGEDTILTDEICEDHGNEVAILQNNGFHHVYSYNGKNVWDLEHHMNLSKRRGATREMLLSHKSRICKTLDYLKLDDCIDVMGSNGLAFTWGRG